MKEWQIKNIQTGATFCIEASTREDAFKKAQEIIKEKGLDASVNILTECIGPKKGKCCGEKK